MRIGIIGLGRIGAFHARTLHDLPAVTDLVVCDPWAGDAAADLAVELDAGVVVDADAMWAAGLDAVVIASSTPSHLALVRAAGVPAFCEKPVVSDPRQAGDLVDVVERSGVPVMVGFPRRFDPAFVAAKADLDAGRLGWLTTIRSTTMDPAPPPAAYIAVSGGIFRDCAIHDLDAVRWATGREVVEVCAVGGNRGDAFIRDAGDVDTASVLLTFDDQSIGVVSVSRYNGAGYDVRLELHGSEGSVAAGLDDGLPMRSADPGTAFPAGPPHSFFMDRLAGAFRAELAAFVELAAGTRTSPCTVADGLEASWLAEACARSLAEGASGPARRAARLSDDTARAGA